jgi:hypothetical protein
MSARAKFLENYFKEKSVFLAAAEAEDLDDAIRKYHTDNLRCTLCGLTPKESKQFIIGPMSDSGICNVCVEKCVSVLDDTVYAKPTHVGPTHVEYTTSLMSYLPISISEDNITFSMK